MSAARRRTSEGEKKSFNEYDMGDRLPKCRSRSDGQLVAPVVPPVRGMAFHLDEVDRVAPRQGQQPFPEIAVLDRLLLRILPAVSRPAFVPTLPETIDQVCAVRVQAHAHRLLQCLQRLNRDRKSTRLNSSHGY